MAKDYRNKLEKVLKQVRPRLASTYELEFKNSFGAVAGYVEGRIFCSCGTFGLALRMPEKILSELFHEKGVRKLKYFPNSYIKKEYAVLPKRILKDSARFKKQVDQSIRWASQPPA